jgi:long-subunit acyl-CoA synthetase (AMP-forming)
MMRFRLQKVWYSVFDSECLLIGVVVSPVAVTSDIDEIVKIFKATKPKIVFFGSDQVINISGVLEFMETEIEIVTIDGGVEGRHSVKVLLENQEISLQSPQSFKHDSNKICAAVFALSGTTGVPKLVQVPNAQLLDSHYTRRFWIRLSGSQLLHSFLRQWTCSDDPLPAEPSRNSRFL